MEGLTEAQAEFLRRITLYGGGEVIIRETNPFIISSLGGVGNLVFESLTRCLFLYHAGQHEKVGQRFRISEDGRRHLEAYDRNRRSNRWS
jgi:hypothetical protein